MTRWFRFYDDAINDPKVLKLSDKSYRIWTGILCIASKNNGELPSFEDMAILLRMKPEKLQPELETLIKSGLIDHSDLGLIPHNWDKRQFKSDVSTERVKRFRAASETPPENREQIQKDSEAKASGADAPIDHRKRLFSEGLPKLAAMTGKGPDACRSFVGKCLKASSDDAVTVLGLIEEAERNQVVDPSAWIAARLKSPENGYGKPASKIIQAADDLSRKIAEFDGPPGGDFELRDTAGAAAPRLLSHR